MWEERYAAFVDRKERRTREAIHPFRTVIDNTDRFTGLLKPIVHPEVLKLYDGPFYYSERPAAKNQPYLNLVFVQDKNGNTGADHPGIIGGGPWDLHLIYEGLSRTFTKAVMGGAGTLRGADMFLATWFEPLVKIREIRGLPRYPTQIVLTESGNLDVGENLLFNLPEEVRRQAFPEHAVIVLTTDQGQGKLAGSLAARQWIRVVSMGQKPDLKRGLADVKREYGIDSISCIGGRKVATGILDTGLANDLYLTTTGLETGEENTPYYVGQNPPQLRLVAKKIGLGEKGNVVFEHFIAG